MDRLDKPLAVGVTFSPTKGMSQSVRNSFDSVQAAIAAATLRIAGSLRFSAAFNGM
jgi:hypothetical protein